TSYLVVWQDGRNAATSGLDIYGTRISAAGTHMDGSGKGFAISTAGGSQQQPAVVWNGTNHIVVWQDDRNAAATGLDIYAARVDSAGAVLDPTGFVVSAQGADEMAPAIAWAGMSHLVVWEDNRNAATTGTDIYGARLDVAGVVLDPSGFAV